MKEIVEKVYATDVQPQVTNTGGIIQLTQLRSSHVYGLVDGMLPCQKPENGVALVG